MKTKITATALSLAAIAALSGCAIAPTGPSVMVLPGQGKNFDQFKTDDAQCRAWAMESIGGPAAGSSAAGKSLVPAGIGAALGAAVGAAFSNGSARGTAMGAGAGLLAGGAMSANSANAAGQSLQQRYDQAYMQCMYANGEKIPSPGRFAHQAY
ncbi:hypothetical protein AQ915_20740 [Burkholderia pseudomallei]|uniref:hypothetical protein n=1 Tax=Burkholderia pseudomallei TaxID=28450 RepID=UPI000975F963|nr:hypothetical protein [Burkholderia pseudomallei]ONC30083.1 hypothetical protein AQ915_20740 [Burkholderia pseudomallei]